MRKLLLLESNGKIFIKEMESGDVLLSCSDDEFVRAVLGNEALFGDAANHMLFMSGRLG